LHAPARGGTECGLQPGGASSGGVQPEFVIETFALGDLCAETWCLWGARVGRRRLQPKRCEQRRLSAWGLWPRRVFGDVCIGRFVCGSLVLVGCAGGPDAVAAKVVWAAAAFSLRLC